MVEKELEKETNTLECVEKNEVLDPTQLLNRLEEIKTSQDIKDLTTLFNISLAKSEMIRALKQNDLYDLVIAQVAERLRKRPDEVSTQDLIAYMNIFKANLDRASGVVEKANNAPTIQINQHKDVTINFNDLNRNSRENVMEAVKGLLEGANADNLEELVNSIQTIDKENDKND